MSSDKQRKDRSGDRPTKGIPEGPTTQEAAFDLRREISRRGFLEQAGKTSLSVLGGLSLTGAALAACNSDKDKGDKPGGVTGDVKIEGGGDTLKVGLIGIFSGPFDFLARIINDSIDAALREINDTRGGIGGRKVEVVKRDTGLDLFAGPAKAYREFAADPDIIGILWFTPLGLDEARPQIQRDNMPVVSAAADLFTRDALYPKSPERSIFQILTPESMATDVLAQYCKEDRGYSRVALIHDSAVFTAIEGAYKKSVEKFGLTDVGIETHGLGASDFGPQLQRLKSKRPEALFIWSLASDTGGMVRQISDLGSAYVDTPTAKGPGWHPQIMGSPGGTGEKTWAENAGEAAKAGSVTPWYLGGTVHLPTFTMSKWMKKYLSKSPTGGEELAADALYTLLHGVEKAGSTDRQKVVTAIETMGKVEFASLPFSFTKDRHVARVKDDFVMFTLERGAGPAKTDPPYELGKEYGGFFPADYVGPTHLVRPTLAANKRAYPDVMETILEDGLGTQCTKKPDGKFSKECKIH